MSGLMYGSSSSTSAGASSAYDYDAASERTFVSFFRGLPAAGPGLVRLFDRGTFYSAHGDDATRVADSVYRTRSVIKQLTGTNSFLLSSVTLNPAAAKSFLRDALSAKQMRVEIYTNGGGKRTANWTVSKQASPGNLQEVEDLLFAHSDMLVSPLVVSFKIKNVKGVIHVGAAFADATNRQLGVAEYADNELFSNTESLLIQVGAKECILPDDKNEKDVELQKLRTVVERSDLVVTPVKRGDFSDKEIDLDLGRLLRASGLNTGDVSMTDAAEGGTGTGVAALPESELRLAMGSLAALISYLQLTSEDANFGAFSLSTHDLGQYLRLDASAIRALALFPDPSEGGGGANRNASLFGLLNKCRTAQGTRLLAQWIKQPLRNLHAIQERQDLVELFLGDVDLRSSLQDECLKVMPDLQRLSKRLQRGVASLEDVVRIYQAALRLPGMIEKLSDARATANENLSEGEPSDVAATLDRLLLTGLEQGSSALENLVAMVEEVLDLDELARHSFVIKPAFDSTLTEIRQQLDQIRDGLDAEHQAAARELGLEMGKKLHLENHAVYGHILRVTRNEAKALRTATKNTYHEVATQKNGVYFRTRKLKELSDDFAEQTTAYEQHQRGVVTEIIATAATYCATLERLNLVIATLDVLLAFAYVSGSAPEPYVKPELVVDEDEPMEDVDDKTETTVAKPSSAPLQLCKARHACVEASDDITFIANDVDLVPGESEFAIITGPNMGGKSTFIRMVGVIAILAQIGCFVPVSVSDDGSAPKLPVFDAVLCRVGAGDNQTKGVSTFMAEMLETATILRTATRDSLIIIDELGRGTSTYDGFGLAWAISHHIATEIRAKCLFATHFHELTTLANQLPYVRNLHVVAHVEGDRTQDGKPLSRDSITLLYQVAPGIGDQSFGIHVAELAHFPPSIIRLAKRKVEELEGPEGEPEQGPAQDEEDGAMIVEEFMAEWARRSAAKRSCTDNTEGDKAVEAAEQKQLLHELVDEYKDKFEGNAWVRNVLASF